MDESVENVQPEPVEVEASPTPPQRTEAPLKRVGATGRRKTSVARVELLPGKGTIRVNRRACEHYFPRETLRLTLRQPLVVSRQVGKYDVRANVRGGGPAGQAGAISLGIARALTAIDETFRPGLREAGLLTRDPRMKERKKYGQKGARKRFQWTKR